MTATAETVTETRLQQVKQIWPPRTPSNHRKLIMMRSLSSIGWTPQGIQQVASICVCNASTAAIISQEWGNVTVHLFCTFSKDAVTLFLVRHYQGKSSRLWQQPLGRSCKQVLLTIAVMDSGADRSDEMTWKPRDIRSADSFAESHAACCWDVLWVTLRTNSFWIQLAVKDIGWFEYHEVYANGLIAL